MMKTLFNKIITFVTLFSFLASPANALNFSFDYSDFGTSGNYKKSIVYTLLAALNASNTAPLTALTGTNLTQTATSPVVVPDSTGTLITIAAGQPAIPGAVYSGGNWSAPESATAQVLASGLTRYTGGPAYNPGLAVLAEPAATNLCLQSQEFDEAVWTATNITIDDQAITAPDGTLTADKYTAANGTTTTVVSQNVSFTSGIKYTLSAYGKKGEYNYLLLALPSSAFPDNNRVGLFNLDTGAVATSSQSGINATITPLADGWYRCAITQTADATSPSANISLAIRPTDELSGVQNGTSGAYLWGAQLETGSVATSYIPTTTAAVTRGPRFNPLTGSELGSKVTVDATPYELGREQYLLGGTTGKIYQGSDNKIYATDGTTTLVSTSLMVANTTATIGVDFAGGKLYFNGVQEDSDVALSPTWGAAPQLGANGSGASVFNGTISVLQSSSDANFLLTSQIINLPNYEKIIYLADRKKKIKTTEEWREAA